MGAAAEQTLIGRILILGGQVEAEYLQRRERQSATRVKSYLFMLGIFNSLKSFVCQVGGSLLASRSKDK